ncbi:condensation domain-containing protein [Micromonospora sp. NPDC051543]|uniref:condensation domain-containing protein n=1 Tax=Micromonospora sp. NPDC051543 TaxID=3364287 RepID=UPI0037905BF5
MWALDQLQDGPGAYVAGFAWRLSGRIDPERLATAVDALVARHEALRTTFERVQHRIEAVVHPPHGGHLRIWDLTQSATAAVPTDPMAHIEGELRKPFDLRRGPIFRAHLYVGGPTSAVLLLTMHHIAVDGGSEGVINRDLGALYRGDSNLPTLATSSDFRAPLVNGEEAPAETIEFWRKTMAGTTRTKLPLDRAAGDRLDPRGATLSFPLAAEDAAAVLAAARRQHATPFLLLLTAHMIALAAFCGDDDIVTGVPVQHRDAEELQDVVGVFVSSLPIRVQLAGDDEIPVVLDRVRDALYDALEHRNVPLQTIVSAAATERDPTVHPLFQTIFSYTMVERSDLQLGDVSATALELPFGTAKFDLTLAVRQQRQAFTVAVEYRTSIFEQVTIAAFAERYLAILRAVTAEQPAPLATLLDHRPARRS